MQTPSSISLLVDISQGDLMRTAGYFHCISRLIPSPIPVYLAMHVHRSFFLFQYIPSSNTISPHPTLILRSYFSSVHTHPHIHVYRCTGCVGGGTETTTTLVIWKKKFAMHPSQSPHLLHDRPSISSLVPIVATYIQTIPYTYIPGGGA